MKYLGLGIGLVLLGLLLAPLHIAHAQPPAEVWICPSGNCGHPGAEYSSIQAGVDAVAAGGTVYVLSGTYTAVDRALAVIDKPLSLVGAGDTPAGSILEGGAYGTGQDTTGLGSTWPRAIVVQTHTVTIKNLRIANFQGNQSSTGGYAIVARAGSDWGVTATSIDDLRVEAVTFEDTYYGIRAWKVNNTLVQSTTYLLVDGVAGYGYYFVTSDNTTIRANSLTGGCIWVTGASNARLGGSDPVDGNSIRDAVYNAIWLGQQFKDGTSSSDGLIQNNVIDGAAEGGIVVWNWSSETADNIRILDNRISRVQGGVDDHGGISIRQGIFNNLVIRGNQSRNNANDQPGLLISASTLNTPDISANIFADNPGPGIRVTGSASGVAAHDNILCNNGTSQVENSSASPVDATGNWWGHPAPIASGVDYTGAVSVTPNVERDLTTSSDLVAPAGGDSLTATVTYADGAGHSAPNGAVITWTVTGGAAAVPTSTVSAGSSSVQVTDDAAAGITITAKDCCGFSQQLVVDAGRVQNVDSGEWFTTIQSAIDDGDTLSNHTLDVWPDTYTEAIVFDAGFTKQGLTIKGNSTGRPLVSGGLRFLQTATLNGLTLENLSLRGVAPGGDAVFDMDNSGPLYDLSLRNCLIDGQNVSGRHGLAGQNLAGSLHIEGCEFANILGWALLDVNTSSGDGGNNLVLNQVTFANNHIHNSNGSVALRGNAADRTDRVEVYDNSWTNIGGNQSEQGQHWAALEINHADVANVYGNQVEAVAPGQGGEGQALQLWDIGTLDLYCNHFTNNAQGVFIFGGGSPYGGPYAVPGGAMYHNWITGNDQYGVSVEAAATGGPLKAEDNWWGCVDGPDTTGCDTSQGGVDANPWLGEPPDILCAPGFGRIYLPLVGHEELGRRTRPGGQQADDPYDCHHGCYPNLSSSSVASQ